MGWSESVDIGDVLRFFVGISVGGNFLGCAIFVFLLASFETTPKKGVGEIQLLQHHRGAECS